MLLGEGKAVVVAGGEQLCFSTLAITVDRTCGVDDVGGLQGEGWGDDRLSGLDGGEGGARALKVLDARRPEDGTTHPTAHPQGGVRGVDDGVGLHGRDVIMDYVERHGSIVSHYR